jgi:WhiB family redox-sensing transcriptional regulator
MQRAACRGQPVGLFYGPDGETGQARAERETHAKAFCYRPCPVRTACLDDALDRGVKSGVWGGLNGDERAAERRRRMRRAS